ncbi:MAG TPA: AMP-binding protein [Micromonosporaceae bacterium]|nr:AMP-binding protein [Micromonosporaceae bacterium]
MPGYESLVDLLDTHASSCPDRPALVFTADPTDPASEETLSYGQLAAQARTVGAVLRSRLAVGERVLLLYPPGLGFAAGFLGTLAAGMVAVPAPPPDGYQRQRERLARIAEDCGAAAVLTESATQPAVRAWARESGLDHAAAVMVTDRLDPTAGAAPRPPAGPDTVAFLQYTSGSTRRPKGVQIDHGNLIAHCRGFQRRSGLDAGTRVGGWLPMYHDFGLVGQLIVALFAGCRSVLMPAATFLRHPHTWLWLIDRYDISVSFAPNFAYDLCTRRIADNQLAGVDLSRWRWAFNGSEPVQARTIRAFTRRFAACGLRPDAVRPGYGMAEATLCITSAGQVGPVVARVDTARLEAGTLLDAGAPLEAGTLLEAGTFTAQLDTGVLADMPASGAAAGPSLGGDGAARRRELVGSGTALDCVEVRIVDPHHRRVLPDGQVGEVWVRGRSVSRGYWRQPEETARVFGNATAGGEGGFLRTGDLGALWGGELYVTGRIGELLVVGGRSLYPQDVEADARATHACLAKGAGAAFPVEVGTCERPEDEIVVVHEAQAGACGAGALTEAVGAVREMLRHGYGVAASVVLVRPGSVPRTTSGKIQRGLTRDLFLAGRLAVLREGLTPRVRCRYRGTAGACPPASRTGQPAAASPVLPAVRGFTSPEHLDRLLGDPYDHRNVFSYANAVRLDRWEELPTEVCQELDRLDLPSHYVPTRYGGRLHRLDELMLTVRVIARRDLTVAVAHAKTFLGACCVWVAGEPEQARALAAAVRQGAVVSWTLTERNHGSDLLSGDITAVAVSGGYRVDGTKWMVNNAARADQMCVAVRTDPHRGSRGFSLLLVDKHALADGTYRCLPRVRTHGVRGADISGITFDGAVVPTTALVGREGDGLEIILKALQVTRTACVALSLGAADLGLALAHDLVNERWLYGGRLGDLPEARRQLGEAYAMLFVAEAVGIVATRLAHTAPEQMSVVSAVVRSFVPVVVDDVLARCGSLLGARAGQSGGYTDSLFGKVERDHRILGVLDGSTFVDQHALVNQFPSLARRYRAATSAAPTTSTGDAGCIGDAASTRDAGCARDAGCIGDAGGAWDAVAAAADLHRTLPELDLSRLARTAKAGCLVVQTLPAAAILLRRQADAGLVGDAVADLAAGVARHCRTLHDELAAFRPRSSVLPAEASRLTGRYEAVLAAAAATQLWLHSHWAADQTSPLWQEGLWLEACLRYLLGRLSPRAAQAPTTVFEDLFAAVDKAGHHHGGASILTACTPGRRP